MIVPILGLLGGIYVGIQSGFIFPQAYSAYVAIGILACLDSLLGGLRSSFDDSFNLKIFISGFFGNAVLSMVLIWLGNQLSIQLSIAAIVVYGSRLFQNFAYIRRYVLNKHEKENFLDK